MPSLPHEDQVDRTLAFLTDGYTFIAKRCHRYGSDLFATRLMLHKVICMMGAEAAQVFYQPERFTRRGAMPKTVLWLLQDQGSVATLDGAAHHHRKQMFLSLLMPPQSRPLVDHLADQWRTMLTKWATLDYVVLLDEVQALLCRAVCAWSGVPLTEAETNERTRELAEHVIAQTHRTVWGQTLIEQVRGRQRAVPEGSAVHRIAWHRDLAGNLLDLYGTNHDARLWYEVPPQDLRLSLTQMPTIPKSRFLIRHVQPIG